MSKYDDRNRSDRQRDDRGGYKQPPPSNMQSSGRQNEYWHLKEGIDREVITADICRYLGPDALVRPGFRMNPQTRQQEEGYWVTAYRNLTSPMIADLKADSLRWENERRNATRSSYAYEPYPSSYVTSQTHKFRQEQGPANSQTTMTSSYASPAPSYTTSGAPGAMYDDSRNQYGGSQQQTQYAGSMQTGYGQPQVDYAMGGTMDYTYGAAFEPSTPAGRGNRPIPTSQPASSTYPTGDSRYAPAPVYGSTNDSRYGYPSSNTAATGYGQPGPADPAYGRGTTYDPNEYQQQYDPYADSSGRYADTTQYSTQSMVTTPSTTVTTDTNPTSRRQHGDRDRHGHSKPHRPRNP